MKRSGLRGPLPQNLGRLALVIFAAGALSLASGHLHPQPVAADGGLGAAIAVEGVSGDNLHLHGVDADVPTPKTPQLLKAEPTGSTSIHVTWQDPNTLIASFPGIQAPLPAFQLSWNVQGSGAQHTADLPALSRGQPLGSYDVTGLQPHTTYCFQIEATLLDSGGATVASPLSAPLCAATDGLQPVPANPGAHCVICNVGLGG